jgi:hypothetical protein
MSEAKFRMEIRLPVERLKEFLQLVRDFERRDPQNITIFCLGNSGLTVEQLQEIFRSLDPPFDYMQTFVKGQG